MSSLNVERETRITPAVTMPIPLGGTCSGSLAAAQTDTCVFTGSAGDIVLLALANTSLGNGFTPVAEVSTAEGETLPGTVGPGGRVQYSLPPSASGTYAIRIHDNDFTQAGEYAVGLEGIKPLSLDAITLPGGSQQTGSLGRAETQMLTFFAEANDVVQVALANTSLGGGFTPIAEVFTMAGENLGTVDPGEQKRFTLPSAGTYLILAHDNNFTQTGSYTVGLERIVPPSPDVVPIPLGGTCSGSLAAAQTDTCVFTGSAGDIVLLALANTSLGNGFTPVAEVSTAEGETLPGTVGPGGRVQYSLPPSASGTYAIRIHDNDFTQAGEYAVGLEGIKPLSLDAITLPGGSQQTGSLGRAETQMLTFFAEANDVVQVALANTSLGGGFTPIAEVFTMAGENLGTVDPGEQKRFTLPSAGTYLILAHDNNFTQTGTYRAAAEWITPLDGSISGLIFYDLNGDGQRTPDEPDLSGWTIFLDADGDGTPDSEERQTLTDSQGGYAFTSLPAGTYSVRFVLPAGWTNTTPATPPPPTVVGLAENVSGPVFSVRSPVKGRRVFYGHSAFDGDAAIAIDKNALLPGQKADATNVTSYTRGINGVMIDLPALPAGMELAPDDFAIRSVTREGDPECLPWTAGPSPSSVTIQRGAGDGGSDRVTLVWPDYNPRAASPLPQAVANGWLEVTMKAGARTGLSLPDVFYFGNLIGDTADNGGDAAVVNASDLVRTRNAIGLTAAVDDAADFDRNRIINATDLVAARNGLGHSLPLFTPDTIRATPIAPASAASGARAAPLLVPGKWAWRVSTPFGRTRIPEDDLLP